MPGKYGPSSFKKGWVKKWKWEKWRRVIEEDKEDEYSGNYDKKREILKYRSDKFGHFVIR